MSRVIETKAWIVALQALEGMTKIVDIILNGGRRAGFACRSNQGRAL
jgi:hypothetical protein